MMPKLIAGTKSVVQAFIRRSLMGSKNTTGMVTAGFIGIIDLRKDHK
jgi:hypothetical protein